MPYLRNVEDSLVGISSESRTKMLADYFLRLPVMA